MSRRCINKITLIGFVGADPTVRYTTAGDAVASLSLATTEYWTDKASKEKRERTEWHRCVAFDKLAENVVAKFVKKGAYLHIEGALRTRKWTDKERLERYTTEIVISDLILLDAAPSDKPPLAAPPSGDDDDIPF